MNTNKGVYLTPSKLVILLFGGVRPLARLLNKTQSSVSKWQKSDDGDVPGKCHRQILDIAKKRGIELTAEDLVFGRVIKKEKVAALKTENNLDPRLKI